MKIGIITFHNASNYGAAFQAYALQRAINTYTEHECEIIDYINPLISSRSNLNKMKHINSLKSLMKFIIAYPYYARKNKVFEQFMHDNTNLSEQSYTADTITQANEEYDIFITGSDQVLNLNLTNNDFNYYLAFATPTKTKCGYAVSQGNFDISKSPESINYLKQFKLLLFREHSAMNSLPEAHRMNTAHVVDPTFLLTKGDWIPLTEPIKAPEKFILLYLVSPKPHNFVYVRQLAKQTKLPIYYINYNYSTHMGMKNLRSVTPGQFLFLIQNATYVVTNSFHGTALSIIFNKKFACELSREKKNANARINELLDTLNLQSRLGQEMIQDIENHIDYETVNKKVAELRENSLSFLRQI